MNERRETRLMTMTTPLMAAVSTVAALMAAQQTLADTATDHRCAKGTDVRRIEIRFADDTGSVPCKVIYRPESESDTLGSVSWQDIPSLAACEAQANEVIERLTVEGWTCAVDQQEGDRTAELADQDSAPDAKLDEIRAEKNPNVDGAVLPSEISPAGDGDEGNVVPDADEPARFIDNPDVAPPSEDLASLIRDDLDQLDTTLDGVLEAKIAGYGDLNADDIDDALVLYTYSSPQPAYRQFLAAYMFDDESYQLTATKPVGGHINATKDARVEAIDGGVIHLTLQAFEPGDASCCPSGTRRLALALRDLDLVEIDADVPTR